MSGLPSKRIAKQAERHPCPRPVGNPRRAQEEYPGIIPTTPILILRFPDGDVEWRSTRGEMPVGAIVRARGVDWRVRAHVDHAVELEPVDSDGSAGPAGGPVTRPTPLGDTPLTFEILQEA